MSASSFHFHHDDDPDQAPRTCPYLHHANNSPASRSQPHPTWDFPLAPHPDAAPSSFPLGETYYDHDASDYYFDNAYHAEPSPPAASFLDSILNPVEDSYQVRFGDGLDESSMSSWRGPGRSGRLSNGYVDLTDSPDVATASRKTRRESPTPAPSSKRQRRNDGSASQPSGSSAEATVEEIDLSDEKQPVQHVLQKQREEAVKAQAQSEEKATTFNTFNCVICMDTPTDLTATACGTSALCRSNHGADKDTGHLFCNTCLMEALIAGENRGNPGEQRRSQCPVCRKNINRSKPSDIIPLLLLKKGLATQPKKTRPVGTNTAAASKVTS